MRHKTRVFKKFAEWSAQGAELVLAVVADTQGSTYSKPGDFMLITGDGRFQGLVSGGCVEGDLAEHATRCAKTQRAAVVFYDLGGDHDALWGMGAGCEGSLRIILLPLSDDQAMRHVVAQYASHEPATLAFEWDAAQVRFVSASANEASVADALARNAQQQFEAKRHRFEIAESSGFGALFVEPAPRVLICGAGADAVPLVEILASLGWRMTVHDHRSAYIDAFPEFAGVEVLHGAAETLSDRVQLNGFAAAMIMSHHLQTDHAYLAQLAVTTHWRYLAVLGPGHRRERLLSLLDEPAARSIADMLKGPAGLPIGGREPVSIALSIAAEMHLGLLGSELPI